MPRGGTRERPVVGPIALVAPFAFPSVRGNAITVERIARGLRARGVELDVWDLSVTTEGAIDRGVTARRPAIVHAFHAYRAGPIALGLAERVRAPLVVTITGTDANQDLVDDARAPLVRRVLEGASAVTVFHESIARRVLSALPGLAARIAVVPQSVAFEDGSGPIPEIAAGVGPLMLFPAGIRPVKNPRFPLLPLDRVAPRHPGFELRYVGPVLDREEGDALDRMIAARPWARSMGALPHARMRPTIEAADIVLNCSTSEGGMANSMLEAMALGRAVLASNIEGNRALVEDGVTGLLFDGADDFAGKADRLLGDPALRRRLGEAGRARVVAHFGPAREIDGYLAVYGHLVSAFRRH